MVSLANPPAVPNEPTEPFAPETTDEYASTRRETSARKDKHLTSFVCEAATMRVLDLGGREVHSAIKGCRFGARPDTRGAHCQGCRAALVFGGAGRVGLRVPSGHVGALFAAARSNAAALSH